MTVQYVWSPLYVDALILRDRALGVDDFGDGFGGGGDDFGGGGGISIDRAYVQQDGNWNVTALINTSGNVVERYIYDPFGQPTKLKPDWSGLSTVDYDWNYLHQGGRQTPSPTSTTPQWQATKTDAANLHFFAVTRLLSVPIVRASEVREKGCRSFDLLWHKSAKQRLHGDVKTATILDGAHDNNPRSGWHRMT
jgi:hypothetical protein